MEEFIWNWKSLKAKANLKVRGKLSKKGPVKQKDDVIWAVEAAAPASVNVSVLA